MYNNLLSIFTQAKLNHLLWHYTSKVKGLTRLTVWDII